jgi:two-component system, chemotaxis family, sensor kinase Cph1
MFVNPVDLTNCDREPIHIPGKVQSHGFLVAADRDSHIISYISENISAFIDKAPQSRLGRPVDDLLADLSVSDLPLGFAHILTLVHNNKGGEIGNPFFLKLKYEPFTLIINQAGGEQIMEFEPELPGHNIDLHAMISRPLSRILAGKNLQALLQNAVEEIKNVIQYDRVMIYKFGEDGHGEVVAEAKKEVLDPLLGLHYPASDIPKQARALYRLNLTRIIADVNKETSSIITFKPAGAPLDLTHSELRAVSPIHIQYLKNMGVASSFSISLIVNKELWGLIACHNYTPQFINYKLRDASKIIGQVVSSALEFRQEEEVTQASAAFQRVADAMAGYIEKEDDITAALTGHDSTIKDIIAASGAVLVFDRKTTRMGITPEDSDMDELVQWVIGEMEDALYISNRLPEVFPPAKNYSKIASGIMACMLSRELGEIIIWFRPEKIEEVTWAGNPAKPVDEKLPGDLLAISPRKSFEKWTEIVKNTSEQWGKADIANVIKIRGQIISAINRKANQIRLLNDRLLHAYEELDTFSHTISHDLRSPLSSIRNYAELLTSPDHDLDEAARTKILERIMFCANKMNRLITEILRYSKMGRAEVEVRPINMSELLQEIKAEVINDLQPENLEFHLGNTPSIRGDAVMINQVFTNLINNAVKYSARRSPAIVKVSGVQNMNEIWYSVSDNGVGIDFAYYSQVFDLFRRMDNAKDFEGTGVGLAIVKRIVEKHKARIWFESTLGSGTTFFIAFRYDH